jgi:glycosyltransferase involved in cell wall biosynthesis
LIRLLFIGVDAEKKGLREALSGFAAARRSGGDARFTVVSRPPADLLEQLKWTPDVRLIPPCGQEDIFALMEESDILVLPTKADTYALSTVEAMARGCAILTSDIEPLPEVVPHGRAGFLVPLGDVAGLTRFMRDLIYQPSLLRTMQVDARHVYLERHTPALFRDRLGQLVDALASGSLLP